MTRIAIIAAMPGELKPLTRGWQHERHNGVDLWRWPFDEGEWIAACAGAGIDAATRAFAEVERLGPVDQVISTGWAGALRAELAPGQTCRVSGVIDARTGERFRTSDFADVSSALKGHGFSRAVQTQNIDAALAAEGMQEDNRTIPQGLKPGDSNSSADGTAEAVPFQSGLWLITGATVADHAEKKHLASTTPASLVDMEAAAIARLAAARAIPFFCVKGISDGYSDQLPDFNRFISPDGRFQLARFVVFALQHPSCWPALIRMGENSKKAARNIAAYLLDLLDAQGQIRKAE